MALSKIFISTILGASIAGCVTSVHAKDVDKLVFNPAGAVQAVLTMPSGENVRYTAYDVNFFLPWNRPHSGDYNLDDLFGWIDSIVDNE